MMKILSLTLFFCVSFFVAQAQTFTGPAEVCPGTDNLYTYADDVQYNSVVWTFTGGGSEISGSGLSRTLRWTADGSVTVSLYYDGALRSQLTKNVTLFKGGTISGPSAVCVGTSATISSTGAYGTTFTWQYMTDGSTWNILTTAGTTSFTHTPETTTSYRVTPTGCGFQLAGSNVISATVSSPPVAGTLALTSASSFCVAYPATTEASFYASGYSPAITAWQVRSRDGVNGVWSVWSAFSTDNVSDESYGVSAASTTVPRYFEFKPVVSSGACTSVSPEAVAVVAYPVTAGGTIAPASQELYGPSSGVLSLSAYAGDILRWESNTGTGWTTMSHTSHSLSYSVSQTTSYRAVIQSGNCSIVNSDEAVLNVAPKPVVSSNKQYLVFDESAVLSAQPGYAEYVWTKPDGTTAPGQSITTQTKGSYTVAVRAAGFTSQSISEAFMLKSQLDDLNMNYIETQTIVAEGITNAAAVDALPIQRRMQSVQYMDELGRPLQTIITRGSPAKLDVVQPVVYDKYGREFRKYLPFVAVENNGRYKQGVIDTQSGAYTGVAHNFYNNTTDKIADDAKPYAETVFEQSPLNRVLKQGAAGVAWQPDSNRFSLTDKTIKARSGANAANEVLLWTYDAATHRVTAKNGAGQLAYYGAGQLLTSQTYDEHGNLQIEYKDKTGLLILKRIQATATQTPVDDTNFANTYYIYDDLGNLRTVLPPTAVEALASSYHNATATNQDTFLKNWAFRYKYDKRNRLIEKQVPGADPVYMVYDKRNRLVLTQDGNQRVASPRLWTFTKYDELNRPIATGLKDTTVVLTQAQMDSVVNAFYNKPGAQLFETYVGNATGNVHGYSNKSYPVVTKGATTDAYYYLTVTYYDNYNFRSLWPARYNYVNDGLSRIVNGDAYTQDAAEFAYVTGRPTGTKTKVLDGGVAGGYTYLNAVSYYDDNGRVIQTISDNYKGGEDRTSTLYDFTGKALITKTTHVTRDVTWKDHTGTWAYGNKLVRTGDAVSGAASAHALSPGQNGWVEFVVTEITTNRFVGFNDNNPGPEAGNINYSFKLGITTLTVVENNITKATIAGALKPGELLRIERTGTTVKYYRNGGLVYTSLTASNTALLVDASFSSPNSSVANVVSSFSADTTAITRTFDYDHAGRLISTWHKIDNEPQVLLAKNEYNEVGQLIDKKLHSTNGTTFKQSLDYRYNIRGWMTKMNESDLSNGDSGDARDYFGFELGYNNSIGTGNAALYNGNISGMKWSSNLGLGDVKEKSYTYSYDAMNRILGAAYQQKTTGWNALAGNGYAENNLTYDLNGNILSLTRYDKQGSVAPMDVLAYDYGTGTTRSNKLLTVADSGNDDKGFKEVTSVGNDYVYDNNGNLVWDKNKGGEEAITNGDFTLGSASWVTGGATSRLTFNNQDAIITAGSVSVTLQQTNIIRPGQSYVVILDSDRTSTSGTFTFNVGGDSYNVVGNGQKVFTMTATSGEHLTLTFSASFAGVVRKIEVKGFAVITYNYLNLPELVTKGEKGVRYMYDATGVKLSQDVMSDLATVEKETDYSGEFIYENDTLKIIQHEEGRIVPESGAYTYQYILKDIWNNTRLTFTTKDEVESPMATMETANITSEASKFLYYEEAIKVNTTLFDHTNAGGTYYSTRLNGSANERTGLARSISVMPGDTIKAEVFAKYLDTNSSNWTQTLNDLMTAIANGTAPAGTFVDGGATGSTGGATPPWLSLLNKSNETGTAPKAYLNYLIFDRDYNLVNGGYVRVTEAAREYGQDGAHEKLATEFLITEPGYVYIYLSNDNAALGGQALEVYFDDLKVTQVKSPIIQTDDYTTFGVTFNSYIRESSLENKIKFQGQERIEDLDLGWDAFKYRNYMPEIGRFFNVDPLAAQYVYNSPYAFAENKLGRGVELEGLELAEFELKKEVQKVENMIMPVVNKVSDALEDGTDWLLDKLQFAKNIPKDESIKQQSGMGVDIFGSSAGADNKYAPRPDQNATNVMLDKSVVDAMGQGTKSLTAPSRPGDIGDMARTLASGFDKAVKAEQKGEIVFENVVTSSSEYSTVKATDVKDTIEYKNFTLYNITTTSGKDTLIQVSNNPAKKKQ